MKRIAKYSIVFFSALVLFIAGMIFLSPYGYNTEYQRKAVFEIIKINATSADLYNYIGDSKNAEDWSTFVDHITVLNPDEYPDGTVGSVRRCFRNQDEKGLQWDEEILINEKDKRRRLSVFNMKGFSLSADHLLTEQLYDDLDNGSCNVALTLFFEENKSNWVDELKFYYAGYRVSNIFRANLENIKRLNE